MNLLLSVPAANATADGADIIEKQVQQSTGFLEKLLNGFLDKLPSLIFGVIIFAIGWFIAKYLTKLIMKFIERSKIDSSAEYFIKSLLLVVFRLLAVLIALGQMGVDVTSIITAVGAATITVGLALQDTLGNIASGVLLIFTHPFKEGDYLKVGSDEGTVTKISLFSTHINTVDNKTVVIPNRNITGSSVINYSCNENRRVDLTFSIAYENDILEVKKLIRKIVLSEDKVLKDEEITVGIFSHNDRCLTIDVKFWCKTSDYWDLYYKLEENINIAFNKNNVIVPHQIIITK